MYLISLLKIIIFSFSIYSTFLGRIVEERLVSVGEVLRIARMKSRAQLSS